MARETGKYYTTKQGDRIHYIVWLEYGSFDDGVYERVMEHPVNKAAGLVDLPFDLPRGIVIFLPENSRPVKRTNAKFTSRQRLFR